MRPFLLPLAALALALPGLAPAQEAPRVLTVTGEGHANVAPDFAVVSLGVLNNAETAGVALRDMSTALDAVIARLTEAGIKAEDVQTSQLTVTPLYDYSGASDSSVIQGFQASSLLNVQVRDLTILGTVLDAVVQDGANQLQGVVFDVTDRDPGMTEARADAVADARARAEVLAEAAGVALGPVLSITDGGSWNAPMPMYDARMPMAEAVPVPMAPGSLGLTANVTLVYAIE